MDYRRRRRSCTADSRLPSRKSRHSSSKPFWPTANLPWSGALWSSNAKEHGRAGFDYGCPAHVFCADKKPCVLSCAGIDLTVLTWDEAKRQANIAKHGYDFVGAKAILDHPVVS